LFASRAPTTKDFLFFEQEHISRELEKLLETTLNFLRKTITSTTTPTPQVIIISDSKEEVEIIPQPIVEE
jgi:hypothetical protein